MKDLFIRTFSVIAIVIFLTGYNMTVQIREKDNEIARLSAELDYKKQEAEYYKSHNVSTGDSGEEASAEYKYHNGIFEGTAKGFGGDITVSVELENDEIKSIEVIRAGDEDGAYLEVAKDIIKNIIKAGSTDVDTISGATFSSTGIKNATINALESAKK